MSTGKTSGLIQAFSGGVGGQHGRFLKGKMNGNKKRYGLQKLRDVI